MVSGSTHLVRDKEMRGLPRTARSRKSPKARYVPPRSIVAHGHCGDGEVLIVLSLHMDVFLGNQISQNSLVKPLIKCFHKTQSIPDNELTSTHRIDTS